MPLSGEDIQKIVAAIDTHRGGGVSSESGFFIAPKDHYDQHQRLDRMLEAYESAQGQIWKWVLGVMLTGGIILSGAISKLKALVGL